MPERAELLIKRKYFDGVESREASVVNIMRKRLDFTLQPEQRVEKSGKRKTENEKD
jgi:hypothetical protein